MVLENSLKEYIRNYRNLVPLTEYQPDLQILDGHQIHAMLYMCIIPELIQHITIHYIFKENHDKLIRRSYA
nr:MAG TPA: hypothetical protein [Caudoviricetes sp.]